MADPESLDDLEHLDPVQAEAADQHDTDAAIGAPDPASSDEPIDESLDGSIIVGIDAGGTKTRVLVATAGGRQLAEVVGVGAAMSPGEAAASADIVEPLVREAMATAGHADANPRVLSIGAAGVGREPERAALQEELTRRAIADETVVETDATIALADAFGEGPGIILIAGTGSIAFGRNGAGVYARCGGWGPTFGDEGSGAWIGRRALGIVAAAHDGREPETALTGAILTAAQVNEVEQLIPWAIAADRDALAALAPSVMGAALQDDSRANTLIDTAVEELVLHIRALGRRLFMDERAAFGVALTGGLLAPRSLVRKRLERRLKTAVPGATIRPGAVDPARGALQLARRLAATLG